MEFQDLPSGGLNPATDNRTSLNARGLDLTSGNILVFLLVRGPAAPFYPNRHQAETTVRTLLKILRQG